MDIEQIRQRAFEQVLKQIESKNYIDAFFPDIGPDRAAGRPGKGQ